MRRPSVVLDFPVDASVAVSERVSERLAFGAPDSIIVARSLDEVVPALARVEALAASGKWAAGFVSYEAAPAFDGAMSVRAGGVMPLLWFGVFDAPLSSEGLSRGAAVSVEPPDFKEATAEARFLGDIERIQEAIRAGETYQVNYTNRLHAQFDGDAFAWYQQLRAAQGTGWHAFIDTGDFRILSASPELFFDRTGDRVVTRPMKGTRPRGRWLDEDAEHRVALVASEKDRAENLMIVDLLRNDIGRIAETGSVEVASLFEVEQYRTVWQLTSRIEGVLRDGIGLTELFRALFPCGSVTGAPKINTMKWIAALEDSPREVYCGAIGVVRPGGDCTFNVPIRTVWMDAHTRVATYGSGGGITIDSVATSELAELRTKADVLRASAPTFELLETMRAEDGVVLRLDSHMRRLRESAEYFGFSVDEGRVRAKIAAAVGDSGVGVGAGLRLRVRVSQDGDVILDTAAAPARFGSIDGARAADEIQRVAMADTPVSSSDVFLFHKTTNRAVYDARLRGAGESVFDALLFNERDELTEFTIGNLVVELDGALLTPSRSCGLLAGVFRQQLLDEAVVREGVVRVDDLARCTRVWLVNSVREWVEVEIAPLSTRTALATPPSTSRAADHVAGVDRVGSTPQH